jgi:hypothetical protein
MRGSRITSKTGDPSPMSVASIPVLRETQSLLLHQFLESNRIFLYLPSFAGVANDRLIHIKLELEYNEL